MTSGHLPASYAEGGEWAGGSGENMFCLANKLPRNRRGRGEGGDPWKGCSEEQGWKAEVSFFPHNAIN